MSGQISANGSAAAYGVYATDGITMTVANGAALSATSTDDPAYAIYDAGTATDTIGLVAGSTVTEAISPTRAAAPPATSPPSF